MTRSWYVFNDADADESKPSGPRKNIIGAGSYSDTGSLNWIQPSNVTDAKTAEDAYGPSQKKLPQTDAQRNIKFAKKYLEKIQQINGTLNAFNRQTLAAAGIRRQAPLKENLVAVVSGGLRKNNFSYQAFLGSAYNTLQNVKEAVNKIDVTKLR